MRLLSTELEYDSNWESKPLAAFQRIAMHFSIENELVGNA